MKRKLRTEIGSHYVLGNSDKPPGLDDIRDITKKANMSNVYRIMNELYPKSAADWKYSVR